MLTGSQLLEKFPVLYGNRRFITAFTTALHPSLSRTRSIQFMPHPIHWRSILILFSHLRLGLPSGLFPSCFVTKTLYEPLLSPYALHAPPNSFFSILQPEQYWVSSRDPEGYLDLKINSECGHNMVLPAAHSVEIFELRSAFCTSIAQPLCNHLFPESKKHCTALCNTHWSTFMNSIWGMLPTKRNLWNDVVLMGRIFNELRHVLAN